jgi:hypothetical protein
MSERFFVSQLLLPPDRAFQRDIPGTGRAKPFHAKILPDNAGLFQEDKSIAHPPGCRMSA